MSNVANSQDWGDVGSNPSPTSYGVQLDEHNKGFYCLVTWMLGITTILIILSTSILAWYGKETPSAFIAIAGVAVGALANLFNK